MAALAAAVAVIGTIGQTLSQVQAARGQARAAGAEAASIREAAGFEERQTRRRAAEIIAKGRAIGAASGIDIASGSPLLMELENVRQAELEALSVRHRGETAARGKQFEAKLARGQIPGIILGGVAKTGSVLSNWMGSSGGVRDYPGRRYDR